MKILFTRCCNSLVVPNKIANKPNTCECGKSSVWWTNPFAGKLTVHTSEKNLWADILCVHNGIFQESGMKTPDYYRNKAAATENSVFGETQSMIVLVPAGTTSDVVYATDEEFNFLMSAQDNG